MLARSVVLNIAGTVGGLVIGFVASLLLGRWLGAADRGLLGVMTSFAGVAVAVLGVGMPMAVTYHASRRETRRDALLGNSLAWGLGLAAVVLPLAWLLHEPLARALGRGHGGLIWVAAAALVPITFLDWTTHNQLLGRLRFGLYNVLVVGSKAITLVLVAVLVVWLDLGLIGAIVATAAASAVMIGGSAPPLLREGRPRLDRGLLRRTIGYGARVQVGSIFQLLNYRLDVLILQAFAPLAVVGVYVIAETIAELSTIVATAFGTSVLPLLARAEGDEAATTTSSSLRHHGVVAAAAVVANAGFGTAVIWWGYGSQFHGAVAPMLILLPAMWFLGAAQVVSGDLRGRGRPGLSSTLAGATAAVTVALDLALIPPFGATGAAVASCVAYVVYGIASILTVSRIGRIPVRELVAPTRSDLAAYPAAVRSLRSRLRGAVGAAGL